MSNNCFLYQYSGVINDDTLPKVNVLNINIAKLDSGNARYFYIYFEGSINIKSYGGYIATSVEGLEEHKTEIEMYNPTISGNRICFENKDYKIEIKSKYRLTRIEVPSSNISPISFDIKDLEKSLVLNSLVLHDAYIHGNIDFSKFVALATIDIRNTSVVCNIETLPIPIAEFVPSSQTSGDLIKLAKRLVGQGTSGVVFKNLNQGSIKFGNYTPTSNGRLNWESASKINYSTLYTNTIYSYGYSDEEIAAWESDGKTVYVVE